MLACAALLAVAPVASAQPINVELILDASGSMFNRLDDGRYRIVAAKEVLADLIAGLPERDGLNVGLRVYGSGMRAMEPGACEDTVLKVGVDGFARQALLDTVRSTQALGATPIALSLEQAAGDFPAQGRNVIVLITDGMESCRSDLREVAQLLTDRGIDLHVIGFDLDANAARSFDGLGSFENARSAAELLAALTRAVELEAAATAHRVTVTLTREGAPVSEGASVTFTGAVDDVQHAFTPVEAGRFTGDLPAGSYSAIVADAFSVEPLTVSGLVVTAEGTNAFAFELAPAMRVTLSLADTAQPAGAVVAVAFEGAPPGAGEVAVAPKDGDAYLWFSTSYTTADASGAGTVDVQLPDSPGAYELRYLTELPEGGWGVIGRLGVVVTAVEASLEVQDEVQAGSRLTVTWTGPGNRDDFITIVPAGYGEGTWLTYAEVGAGSPLSLQVPDTAGDYEVRYVTGNEYLTLAAASVRVVAAEVTMSAVASAPAGAAIEVRWTGPGNPDDFITIVPPDSAEGSWEAYTMIEPGVPARIRVPDYEGEYEIRYVSGNESLTLARLPLTVTPLEVSIEASPASVGPDQEFTVRVSGPYDQDAFLTVVPVGTDDGNWDGYYPVTEPAVLVYAPSEPGAYEIRYVTGQQYRTLVRVPLTVR